MKAQLQSRPREAEAADAVKLTKSKLRRRSQEEFEAANLEDVIEKSEAANPEAEVDTNAAKPRAQSQSREPKV